MDNKQVFTAISKHLSGEETPEERTAFLFWLNEKEENSILFEKAKALWNRELTEEQHKPFLKKFNRETIKDFVINQALGNFVGFIVGMSVTHMFSHYVLEKRSFKNLFGLAGRKKVQVNDIPEWLQWTISAIIGWIALEYVNHLIQTKKHILAWNYIKKRLRPEA